MPIDPSKVAWDAPDPKAVKWDEPAATGKRKPPRTLDVLASAPFEALAGAALGAAAAFAAWARRRAR